MNQIPESLFKKFGFSTLTEIQKKASPIILQKKDCLVIAPTGSGKTECSIIPIWSLLKNSTKVGKIKVLYITPLRALNRDVFRRITKYAISNELSIEIRHGDTSQKDRRKIAITVISGYGVGADTTARILRNMVDEEYLFKQIYEAERQYVVTRSFWDS
jgi:Lhr-like helicase